MSNLINSQNRQGIVKVSGFYDFNLEVDNLYNLDGTSTFVGPCLRLHEPCTLPLVGYLAENTEGSCAEVESRGLWPMWRLSECVPTCSRVSPTEKERKHQLPVEALDVFSWTRTPSAIFGANDLIWSYELIMSSVLVNAAKSFVRGNSAKISVKIMYIYVCDTQVI